MVGRRVFLTLGKWLVTAALVSTRVPGLTQSVQFRLAGRVMKIDGRLDESALRTADAVTRFFEVYPANLGEPTVRTEARFLFDEHYFYVGIRAYDPNPSAIRSAPVRRDQVLTDQDYVEVLIDPANGGHSVFLSRTNQKGGGDRRAVQ
jgi:hypothetical protein